MNNDIKKDARELVDRFYPHAAGSSRGSWKDAKACAIIAVDLVLKVVPMYTGELNPEWQKWVSIKTEIEKL